MHNPKKDAPSFHRNIAPIKLKLSELFDGSVQTVLEIGCGSGQHIVELAQQFPKVTFYPTDKEQENIESTDAWVTSADLENVKRARILDVVSPKPEFAAKALYDAILCFNVIHIGPWPITESLFKLASQVLTADGKVFLYGPFRINGEHTSESNRSFDRWLKSQSEEFGVRSIEEVMYEAEENALKLSAQHEMPSNNYIMEFHRR